MTSVSVTPFAKNVKAASLTQALVVSVSSQRIVRGNSHIKIQNNRVNTVVAVIKWVLGAVPFAGGAMAELIGTVLPNQRLERITAFLIELDKRLGKIEIEKLNQNKFALDLIEDGIHQAVRVLSDSRNTYLASFLKQTVVLAQFGVMVESVPVASEFLAGSH